MINDKQPIPDFPGIPNNTEFRNYLDSLPWELHVRFQTDAYESINMARIANKSVFMSAILYSMKSFKLDDTFYRIVGTTLERTSPKIIRPVEKPKMMIVRPNQMVGKSF